MQQLEHQLPTQIRLQIQMQPQDGEDTARASRTRETQETRTSSSGVGGEGVSVTSPRVRRVQCQVAEWTSLGSGRFWRKGCFERCLDDPVMETRRQPSDQ